MGHQRLGTLPRSKHWNQVIELITGGNSVSEIAAAASSAAEQSMIDASGDAAVRYSLWLLAKIPLAAREDDFCSELRALGLEVPKEPLLVDVVCGFVHAVDQHVADGGTRTDFGEIAELSAAEALYAVGGREVHELFGTSPESIKKALAGFATVKQFAVLARDFFARLTRRHLDYYLSRELSRHVGPTRRFTSLREHRAFEQALDLHCRETTRIIQEYSGEWLSKHNFEGGIDLAKAGRFVAYASQKIRDELEYRRALNA
jgi:hypothetical protein